jgi:nicotinate-nucleotide pyrophosphorylase (carboxylating)
MERKIRAQLIANEDFVFAGRATLEPILQSQNHVKAQWLFKEGELVLKQQTLLEIKGPFKAYFAVEKLFLETVQTLSGIATLSRLYSQKLQGSRTRLVVPPQYQDAESLAKKAAFLLGSGSHGEAVEALEVHQPLITAFGGYGAAKSALQNTHESIFVECRSPEDFETAIKAGFSKFILRPDLALRVAKETASCQVLVRGSLPLETVTDFAGLKFHYLEPDQLAASIPRAEAQWNLLCE